MNSQKEELKNLKLHYKEQKHELHEEYIKQKKNIKEGTAVSLHQEQHKKSYSLGEEIFNSVSHGIGAGLAIAAIVLLVVKAAIKAPEGHKGVYVTTFSIFGFSLFLLYIMSTLYHALTPYKAKNVFQIFDHSSIYILIAGTYTPFCLIGMNTVSGWVMFGIIWGIAAFGVTMYSVFGNRMRIISAITYLPMGSAIFLAFNQITQNVPSAAVTFLIAGGICYVVGWPFYLMKKIKWTHSIFHVFVLAGSILHFFSIFFLL